MAAIRDRVVDGNGSGSNVDYRHALSGLGHRGALLAVGLLAVTLAPACNAQLSLYSAVDLALRNSPAVQLAGADVQRATVALGEARDVYVPNLVLGSGLGYSYGFPLGEPSIFNVSSQSLVLSFSQRDYIRSARAGLNASELAMKDARQQVVLDTALDYIQLDKISRQTSALDAQSSAAERLAAIEQERVDAGLEPRTELLRARLIGAQLRLKRLHVEDDASGLRLKLAHLTGLPASNFATDPASIPPLPTVNLDSEAPDADLSVAMNQGVQAAYAAATARKYIAFGDRRQNLRPQVAFAAQYSRFSTFNNYQTYYSSFQANNLGIGISISIPLFDASRRDKARESAADATHAAVQADQARDVASEEALQLRKSLRELTAQEEVARLQSELSAAELQVVLSQLESGSGSASRPQPTPKDEQQARIEDRQRYQELLDADFDLTRAQLSLLRTTGAIEDWVRASLQRSGDN